MVVGGPENNGRGLVLADCGLTSIGASNCESMSIGISGLGTLDSPVGGVAVVVGKELSGSGLNASVAGFGSGLDSVFVAGAESSSETTSGLTATERSDTIAGKVSSEC